VIKNRQLILPWTRDSDAKALRSREWLITNGLGGYASGTLSGIPARKYHGLLVANLTEPKGRHIMVSRCDEVIYAGARRLHLGGAEFGDESIVGESHEFLTEFRLDHRIAVWRFEFEGHVLEKSIVMPHNQNTVCVRYELIAGEKIDLHIRPYLSFRRHDESPRAAPDEFTLMACRGRHEVHHASSDLVLRMAMRPGLNRFVTEDRDEIEFFYRIEHDRGDPSFESSHSPGYFAVTLDRQEPATAFLATTHGWDRIEFDIPALFDAERRRIDSLLRLATDAQGDDFAEQLVMAADQFIVLPGSRLEESAMSQAAGSELRTIYAGYHWFGDWGRDTMISLEGLTLCTGRHREAGAILRTFSQYVKDGLLPNLFPEGQRQALYHTVDATLWYFHAIARYASRTGDRLIVEQLFPVLESIVQHYLHGTRFNIGVDANDGLVSAAEEGYQLTWMDAKVDGWVVTPRRGKPVEIQALWYNALRWMGEWARKLNQPSELYDAQAARVQASFNQRYWNAERACLFDVVDGPNGNDAAIRPNQVFSMSLDHPVLDRDRWVPMLDTVRNRLLTPYGLRTLSADHPDYKAHYRGDLRARDAAYHQGTVWPWLIGHYVDATLKLDADPSSTRQLLLGFRDHLFDAGIGSISEIFDAEEPYAPGGCVAQAWSIGEVLRAWIRTAGR
jgi:predicted glycogen debranching enzyme